MSNNISADTLFHFMKKYEYLETALKQEFSPRYYKEDLTSFFESTPVYIAMKEHKGPEGFKDFDGDMVFFDDGVGVEI